ncbi:MAG TPA: hypothetical protein VMF56_02700 [Acidobacteriaceae bacterium]|nr:hypothetical protein [Acidobacteriaceae bacterium]
MSICRRNVAGGAIRAPSPANPVPTPILLWPNGTPGTAGDTPVDKPILTNDETVMNSVMFYEALLRSGVPAELHIFEQGHHGSGLAQDNPQLRMWPILPQNWLHLHGWMDGWMDGVRSGIGREL